jgi:formylglycine-generating enzyme required for sulfatase activity
MRLFVLPVILCLMLVMSGCGGSEQVNQLTEDSTKRITGRIVDGPISGCFVGVDRNFNHSLEDSEILTQSDSLGFYSLWVDRKSVYPLIMQSGLDTSTQLPFEGVMLAPMPSATTTQTISPLTTLLSFGASQNSIKEMFGLSGDFALNKVDPTSNLDLLKAGIKAHVMAIQLSRATSLPAGNVYEEMAKLSTITTGSIQSVYLNLQTSSTAKIGLLIDTSLQAIEQTTTETLAVEFQSVALGAISEAISKTISSLGLNNNLVHFLSDVTQAKPSVTNTVGMSMTLIPSGVFEMDSGWSPQHLPRHSVTISKGFYIGTYEVTQANWEAVVGEGLWPGGRLPSFGYGPDYPVNEVTWFDAMVFVARLNELEGTERYRLPTEAEWEYSASAGTGTTAYLSSNLVPLTSYAWFNDNSDEMTNPVGGKLPNPWGLFDTIGNVQEWTQDWAGQLPTESVTDPIGPPFSGRDKIAKGGSFYSLLREFRWAIFFRYQRRPVNRGRSYGFRIVRELD